MSLLSLFRARPARGQEPQRRDPPLGPLDATTENIPSADPGIHAGSTETLLQPHHDLLSRLKLCYGSDKAVFERDLLAPIHRLAEFVNALPATADNYFCDRGGLLRLALEVAFFALQGTDGHIVASKATISERRVLEPRWRLATFYAGLCSELHRTLSQLVVTDEKGAEWPSYLGGLSPWLASRGSKRFFVRWLANAQESRGLGVFALPHVLLPETAQHLSVGNRLVMPQLLASIAGTPCVREQSLLVELVRRSTALVINRDLISNANRYGRPILGAHIERYLIDAMRRLVLDHPAWSPNQERSRVWHARDGLFVVWPNAALEIRKLLEADELPGIPQDPQTILEILLRAGVALPHPSGASVWTIAPQAGKAAMEAIRLVAPEILLTAFNEHNALDTSIVSTGVQGNATKSTLGPRNKPAPLAANAAPSAAATEPRAAEPAVASSSPAPLEPREAAVAPSPQLTLLGQDQPDPENVVDPRDGAQPDPEADPVGDPDVDPESDEAGHELQAALDADVEPFRLDAPFRLAPQVRDALAEAVDSLNGDAKAALAVTVPTGVFVALEHFKRCGIDAAVVLRSLDELSMTVAQGGRTKTVQHDFCGRNTLGFVLLPRFVAGLDPSQFAPPTRS